MPTVKHVEIWTSVVVAATPDDVWCTFVNTEEWPAWSPWGVTFPNDPGFKVGQPFQISVRMPWLPVTRIRARCELSEMVSTQAICWTGTVLTVPGYHRFTLSPVSEGCLVRSEEKFDGLRAMLLRPFKGLIRSQVVFFLDCLNRAASITGQ